MNADGYYNPHLNVYQLTLLSSPRYLVMSYHDGKDRADNREAPSHVEITVLNVTPECKVTLRGENAREFQREFYEKRAYIRGDEGSYQEWRWYKSVFYPLIMTWVSRATNVKFALDAMGVYNTHKGRN